MKGRMCVLVTVLALEWVSACSGNSIDNRGRAAGAATDAGLVARDYVRALAAGQATDKALLNEAYSMLLPRQRAAIPEGFYTECVLQDDTQGNTQTTEVRKVEDDGDFVPPGYSKPLPTKTVFVTLPGDYNRAPDWYGKLRVSKDAGHWYVSVAAPAFKNYGEGNCEYSIWEYPVPPAPTTPRAVSPESVIRAAPRPAG
jgi:hypothetical protein